MNVPQSHCCNCFKQDPETRYTYVTTVPNGAIRYTHKMDVPLCADCFKRVSRGLQIKIAYLAITGGLLLLALMPKFEMNFFVFLIGIFLMVGFAIPVNMINRWLKMEFAKVEIVPVLGAQVTFLHPEYQKLFLQANPVEVAKQRSMQQAALQYLSKSRK